MLSQVVDVARRWKAQGYGPRVPAANARKHRQVADFTFPVPHYFRAANPLPGGIANVGDGPRSALAQVMLQQLQRGAILSGIPQLSVIANPEIQRYRPPRAEGVLYQKWRAPFAESRLAGSNCQLRLGWTDHRLRSLPIPRRLQRNRSGFPRFLSRVLVLDTQHVVEQPARFPARVAVHQARLRVCDQQASPPDKFPDGGHLRFRERDGVRQHQHLVIGQAALIDLLGAHKVVRVSGIAQRVEPVGAVFVEPLEVRGSLVTVAYLVRSNVAVGDPVAANAQQRVVDSNAAILALGTAQQQRQALIAEFVGQRSEIASLLGERQVGIQRRVMPEQRRSRLARQQAVPELVAQFGAKALIAGEAR